MAVEPRGYARGDGIDRVYWRPTYAILGHEFEVLLVNARHAKNVPGLKTDGRDSEWLAQPVECGLLKGSLIPPQPIRDLRDLKRYRKTLIRERGDHVNRVAKTLELANIKLGSVVADIKQDGSHDHRGAHPGPL